MNERLRARTRLSKASSAVALGWCWLGLPACGGVDDGGASGEGQAGNELRNSDPNTDEPSTGCAGRAQGTLTASSASVSLGQSVTLTWHASIAGGCGNVSFHLGSAAAVAASGSMTVTPQANISYSLTAVGPGVAVYLATVSLNVALPPAVTITANNQIPMLAQALATPGEQITVQNQVDMDMSYLENIVIAAGVTLRGGRTPRDPGPRFRTTTRPSPLFLVKGDGVHITGVRIEGPDMGVPGDDEVQVAIYDNSFVNVQIDNNELSGWSGSAVKIEDDGQRIDYVANPETVHVHDNYIHNNQHEGRQGYGVVIGNGAYALIDQNVFDWNRHAIAGDGSSGSGYHAFRNLVLPNGGLHRWVLGFWTHTHQFDMHGQSSCGVGAVIEEIGSALDISDDPTIFNCGTAGHDMFIRDNTFLYTDGPDIKLRGTPELSPWGMTVANNVFANNDINDAVQQAESGLLIEDDNQTGFDGSAVLGSCDFDADGVNDSFMATGTTWWFSARGTGPWTYLNTSTKRLPDVSLGYFDADPRCDVSAGGTVYSGGKPVNLRASILATTVKAKLAF
ncbi:MAG TPA: hypothetical protein VH062_34160 [Polyangiaceae bacterium]|jgi:hypothetical protein|nr:hypothetical protein [Polyangiaceae bacterium]